MSARYITSSFTVFHNGNVDFRYPPIDINNCNYDSAASAYVRVWTFGRCVMVTVMPKPRVGADGAVLLAILVLQWCSPVSRAATGRCAMTTV